ncbi:hypothetical protein C5167_040430 [Papaver somniferum]|uniref:Uncharacterized protein n=1 Tax=Papaver somniferum TaxID=3469 RepID=A0A4Y7IHD8_PAPSO|nr:hypothetical protein C5167_040430 [Papaver somniferum]
MSDLSYKISQRNKDPTITSLYATFIYNLHTLYLVSNQAIKFIFTRTIFLIMFLLIGSNLQRIVPPAPAKDGNELAYIKMKIDTSRKLLRVREYKFSPPTTNRPFRRGPPHTV